MTNLRFTSFDVLFTGKHHPPDTRTFPAVSWRSLRVLNLPFLGALHKFGNASFSQFAIRPSRTMLFPRSQFLETKIKLFSIKAFRGL